LHALGIAGAALFEQYPKAWRTHIKALKKVDWSRSNVADWDGRALLHGRISKASTNVQLTAIFLKQAMDVKLSEEDMLLDATRARLS
jgi:DNA sulfur modification protein DndB